MGTTIAQIRSAVPALESWLNKVFLVMGGFMAGAGLLTMLVSNGAALTRSTQTPSWALALSGGLTVGLMSATNFALGSDFKWVLIAPVAVWLAAIVLRVAGTKAAQSKAAFET